VKPVLVVDDDDDIRESIAELLEVHGIHAITATNGSTALATLATADPQPCLILLDLMMPVMDGRSFRAEQLEHPEWSEIPVVLMSAYRDVAEQAKTLSLDHLAKPLGAKALIATARRYCTA
jgi:CheY-like chemotaxis protein